MTYKDWYAKKQKKNNQPSFWIQSATGIFTSMFMIDR